MEKTTAYYDSLGNEILPGTGFVGVFAGNQLHPPMVDSEHFLNPMNWKEGVRVSTRLLANRMSLGPSSLVLDVGCGVGGVSLQLTEEYRCTCVGVNMSQQQIDTALRLHHDRGVLGNTFINTNALRMPFSSGHFSHAICMNMAYHVEDIHTLFQEMARCLAHGGLLGFDDWCITDRISVDDLAKIRYEWSCDDGFHTRATYLQAAHAAGLKPIWRRDCTSIAEKLYTSPQRFQQFRTLFRPAAIAMYGKESGTWAIENFIDSWILLGRLIQEGKFEYRQIVFKKS